MLFFLKYCLIFIFLSTKGVICYFSFLLIYISLHLSVLPMGYSSSSLQHVMSFIHTHICRVNHSNLVLEEAQLFQMLEA